MGGLVSRDATGMRKIKSRNVMTKATFIKNKDFFLQQIGLTFKEETNEVLHFEHSLAWC